MQELLRLLKRDWSRILLIMLFFVFSVYLGTLLPKYAPELAQQIQKEYLNKFSGILELMKNAPLILQILIIFGNNLMASLIVILTGMLIVPVIPLFSLVGNGVGIGLLQTVITAKSGFDPTRFYLALLPHGIFELTAFFIAVLMGVRFGLVPYRLVLHYYRTKEYQPFFLEYFQELRYYGVLILVLLAIAAVIEMTVSPLIL